MPIQPNHDNTQYILQFYDHYLSNMLRLPLLIGTLLISSCCGFCYYSTPLSHSFKSCLVSRGDNFVKPTCRVTTTVPRLKNSSVLLDKKESLVDTNKDEKKPSILDEVASKGLAGILAIAAAEAIFWALGVPLAAIYYKFTTGEWIDLATTDGQLKAAGFSFGYGGFATVILQYRVTLFAIPLIPIMEKLIVQPGKKFFGDKFGAPKESNEE